MFIAFMILWFIGIGGSGLFYVWTGKPPWGYLRRPLPTLSLPINEKTLESWHDAYDKAILEGKDEVEAVREADFVTQAWLPPAARNLYPNPTRALSHKKLWEHALSDPLIRPGKAGGMGMIRTEDDIITLKWGGMTTKMTTEEWVRQGRPSAEQVITTWHPIQRFQDSQPAYLPITEEC